MPHSIATTHSERPRIAIIGGGISGLAAAHRITELVPKAELTLFEAANRLGGVLETIERDGCLVERSADNFLTSRPGGVELCKRLGLAEQLLPTDETRRRAHVVRDGRLLPIPAGFYLMSPRRLGPILASPILSIRGKLRLLAEPLIPPRGKLSAEAGTGGWGLGTGDESVASFARRRLGREVFERLVQPLVAGIYTADSEQLSMAATMPDFLAYERQFGSLLRATVRMRHPEGTREFGMRNGEEAASGARYGLFVAPKQGMRSIVAALAQRLPGAAVRLNTPVHGIQRTEGDQWLVEFDAKRQSERFDGVILSLPAYAVARALRRFDAHLSAELDGISYAGCVVVSCAFHGDQIAHPLDSFGFVVPQIEGRRIVAGSFASNKFPGRAPDSDVLIRTFVGGSLQPELMDLTDDELRRLVLDELAELLTITGTPRFTDIARWPQSMPQYHVGHLARVERIERLAERWPGLALAGNAYRGVGIPQCISSGEAAAERIAAKWKTDWPLR